MGFLDSFTPGGRRWREISSAAENAIYRAAGYQGQNAGIQDATREAQRLAGLYQVHRKPARWQEFGEVAFHLAVGYPPDLAYIILYSFRDVGVTRDLVPFILKALEEIYSFRPSRARFGPELLGLAGEALTNAELRAQKAARILARELSVTPLRYASAIWVTANRRGQPFLHAALAEFNPRAAEILARRPQSWWLTPTAVARGCYALLFGRDDE